MAIIVNEKSLAHLDDCGSFKKTHRSYRRSCTRLHSPGFRIEPSKLSCESALLLAAGAPVASASSSLCTSPCSWLLRLPGGDGALVAFCMVTKRTLDTPSNRRPRVEQSNGYFDIITCRLPDDETAMRAQSQNACSCVMLVQGKSLPTSVSQSVSSRSPRAHHTSATTPLTIFYTVSISQRTAPLPPSCPCLLPASKFGGVLEFSRDSSELELLTINVRYMYFVWKLVLGCEVLLCDPCARCVCVCPVLNVNTTDATTGGGATALLLPAQNTHTLHDPIRDTEQARRGARSMRALAALSRIGLGVGGLEDGANMAVGCWRRGA